ncbi:MAG: endonuclease/exonuclease/phosphatase family protein [Myxococcota bacterium]|nr:endonuclease/exonuclease/phosphatase family protein [Myxococcota bacterium]
MLRVMTYNVRYFGQSFAGAGSSQRSMRLICKAIAGLRELPDIICFQEIEQRSLRSHFSHESNFPGETQFDGLQRTLEHALEQENKTMKYQGLYFPAHAYRIGKLSLFTMGLGILVSPHFHIESHNSGEPKDVTFRRIQSLANLKQSRICAHVRLRSPKDLTFDIFNTHLSLPAFATRQFWQHYPAVGYGRNQQKEVSHLAKFIQGTAQSDRYFIVGDLNAAPGTPSYKKLLMDTGAEDPFCSHLNVTEAELMKGWPTAGFLNLKMRLDHILVGPGITCHDLEDCHPFTELGRWSGLSDHVPLLGRFIAK